MQAKKWEDKMLQVFKNATVLTDDGFKKADIYTDNGIIVSIGSGESDGAEVFDFNNCYILAVFGCLKTTKIIKYIYGYYIFKMSKLW